MSEDPTRAEGPGAMERTKQAAAETAGTVREQAREVTGELRHQTGQAVGRLRERVRDEADSQGRRAAQAIRQWAEDLHTMTDMGKPDSPVQGVVRRVAEQGRRAADYLDERGLSGLTDDLQRFARRRPGLFLAAALAAGFVVGRVARASARLAREQQERQEQQEGAGGFEGGDLGATGVTRAEREATGPPGRSPFADTGSATPYTGTGAGTEAGAETRAGAGTGAEAGTGTATPGQPAAGPGYPAGPGYVSEPGRPATAGGPAETGGPPEEGQPPAPGGPPYPGGRS
ncbi:hypothetical protein [Thermoactinospora rubra]|uniref:hypothetical protein n=1 Tax=Thermoactinospora rubra TaxID=1088767 RepID=UPI00117D0CBA|nr:hypothetical protein [Thermoactinospora rubra]